MFVKDQVGVPEPVRGSPDSRFRRSGRRDPHECLKHEARGLEERSHRVDSPHRLPVISNLGPSPQAARVAPMSGRRGARPLDWFPILPNQRRYASVKSLLRSPRRRRRNRQNAKLFLRDRRGGSGSHHEQCALFHHRRRAQGRHFHAGEWGGISLDSRRGRKLGIASRSSQDSVEPA
jgi:hypothetical protein